MLKEVQVTLYDVFGYLLPGFILLLSLGLLCWSIYFSGVPLILPAVKGEGWAVILITAYVLGHLNQAIGNLVLTRITSVECELLAQGSGRLCASLITSLQAKVSEISGISQQELDYKLIYQFCDEAIVQFGVSHDRDLYVHREGFYRGLFIALTMLSLALLVRLFIGDVHIKVEADIIPLQKGPLVFLLIVILTGALLSYLRFRRFGRYRVRQAVLGFLAIYPKKFH